MIFNSPPTGPGAQPDRLIGEARSINEGPLCRIDSLTTPGDAFITADGKLIVADTGNNRVLIWSSLTSSAPSVVLGQDAFDRCAANDDNQDGTSGNATARTLHHPAKVWSDGTRLLVSDYDNNRVLIWNRFPTGNFQPADVVLGQSTFAGAMPNDDNQDGSSDALPSARTFDGPYGISVDGNRLAIADGQNNRVLIWEQFPQQNFQPANVVIGQASFVAKAANDSNQDGVSESVPSDKSLSNPGNVLFHGGDLLVEDGRNHRILVFKRQQ
ncbi:hypothetical protein ASG30_16110 [Ramlibacter sp. Leaf400]|nr:hypothetical protein ASG30_16110 [Ramlibacter sp. Leaf400]